MALSSLLTEPYLSLPPIARPLTGWMMRANSKQRVSGMAEQIKKNEGEVTNAK